MSRIMSVTPMDGYRLKAVLDNGSSITIDFTGRLHTVRFSILSDKEYFNTVTTDGTFVRWNYKIEISLNEFFALAQN